MKVLFILLINWNIGFKAFDGPNDSGDKIIINIKVPYPDSIEWLILYRENLETLEKKQILKFKPIKFLEHIDKEVDKNKKYKYILQVIEPDTQYVLETGTVIPVAQWFHSKRFNVLVILVFYTIFLLFYLARAKKEELFLRKIPGLDAVEEAVGRSTEMGRPILFVLGLDPIHSIATIAGISILSRVAKKTAEYEADILVPCFDPIVMAAAQETVKQSYLEAGRPDLYNEKNIFFLTADQFGYAAGVDGIMLREKPGAVFFQGFFYAESLILAETGYSIGAIQIAGTTAVTQLPFFIAACDYTLIGEELFAASAYLTKDPTMVSTIKGEDLAKAIFMVIIGLGTLLATIPFTKGIF
jgi:hypothetical protein